MVDVDLFTQVLIPNNIAVKYDNSEKYVGKKINI